ncbi:hypothetical protein PVK06_035932 [Gossypium arboreum]|uniref:Uncharacterized protein n=1 Tax=Gossypium arboreum TaxID=29729 RepID=A0ABR0NI43_GOSAR|nr:hypothetical protein PVK06_035932 [Gossypium arboreum]
MKKLTNFVEKRLKSERTASIWTSTLQRTILTTSPIDGFPKVHVMKYQYFVLEYRYSSKGEYSQSYGMPTISNGLIRSQGQNIRNNHKSLIVYPCTITAC